MQPGNVITVYLYQAKNGTPVGRAGSSCSPMARYRVAGTLDLMGRPNVIRTSSPAEISQRPAGRKTTNKE